MFSLFDIPAYVLWAAGSLFQGIARCIGSKAFISWKNNGTPEVSEESQVSQITELMKVIDLLHTKVYKTPLVLTLINSRHGYCIYNGAHCLTTGTLEECKKFLKALVWFLHTK